MSTPRNHDTRNGILAAIAMVVIAFFIYLNATTEDTSEVADYGDDFDTEQIAKANKKPAPRALNRAAYNVPENKWHDIIKAKQSEYDDKYIPVDQFDPFFHNDHLAVDEMREIFEKENKLYEDDMKSIYWVFAYTQNDSPKNSDFRTVRVYVTSHTDKSFRVYNEDFGVLLGEDTIAHPKNTKFDYVKLKGEGDTVVYDLHFQVPNSLSLYKLSFRVADSTTTGLTDYHWNLLK